MKNIKPSILTRIKVAREKVNNLVSFNEVQRRNISRVKGALDKYESDCKSNPDSSSKINSKLWETEQLLINVIEIEQLNTRFNAIKDNTQCHDFPLFLLADEALDSLAVIVENYEKQLINNSVKNYLTMVPIEVLQKELDERNALVEPYNANIKRLNNSGAAIQNKYQKIPRDALRIIIPKYATDHPHLLTKDTLVREVKSDLRKKLKEKLIAGGMREADIKKDQSLNKDVEAILNELGYPYKVTQ